MENDNKIYIKLNIGNTRDYHELGTTDFGYITHISGNIRYIEKGENYYMVGINISGVTHNFFVQEINYGVIKLSLQEAVDELLNIKYGGE